MTLLQHNAPGVLVALPEIADGQDLSVPASDDRLLLLDGETMGTVWTARFFAPAQRDQSGYRAAIESSLADLVRQMSHWDAGSDLAKFNGSAAGTWHTLPLEFFRVLEFALQVAGQSDGAFDPTVGALVDEWGFGPGRRANVAAPTQQRIDELRAQVGWRGIEIDARTRRARHSGNPHLDLSAVAKGFAVDFVARSLEQLGIESYLVEIGGEFRARGLKKDLQPWWVDIEPLGLDSGALQPVRVALSGWSIATSGDYRRYVDLDGVRRNHTVDPRTGNALRSDIAQVSVVHKDCMAADAYSTAVMVLGAEAGLRFAQELGLAAVVVLRTSDGLAVRCTEAFSRMVGPSE